MASLNRIILIGRLTADPEARTTMDGTAVTKFTLAVDRNRPSSMQKETDFIDIVSWGKLAEICGSYLKNGQMALVEGRIQNRTYETKEGVKKYITEVIARSMTMLEKGLPAGRQDKGKGVEGLAQEKGTPEPSLEEMIPEDDLPF